MEGDLMDLINILFAKALNNGDTTKEYVDEAIKALKGEVNADLDTLEELSKALGNDPDFFLNVKNQLDKKITQEEFNSAIANLVSISNYNPIDKTDSMTQPVGKSADGKLWTSPGSGTGSATPRREIRRGREVSREKYYVHSNGYNHSTYYVNRFYL